MTRAESSRGVPRGIRTRVADVRGRRPWPARREGRGPSARSRTWATAFVEPRVDSATTEGRTAEAAGVEPARVGLTGHCSATELRLRARALLKLESREGIKPSHAVLQTALLFRESARHGGATGNRTPIHPVRGEYSPIELSPHDDERSGQRESHPHHQFGRLRPCCWTMSACAA